MARHQTNCHWAIEFRCHLLAGIAIAAVAAVGFLRNGGIAILSLSGLPTVIFFAIGFRVSSAALRNRRSVSRLEVEGDKEDGTLRGIAAGHGPQRHRHRGSNQLPAIVIAQLGELSHNKVGGGGVGEECAICLCKIGNDGVPTRQLPVCRHVLHRDSIEQWLRVHPTCPICRCKVPR
ncbi:LOW QUALITY PROTEIN: hypothetical protein GQ55_4G124000 [Panicum hallii var. hallii]|uniref:RING-type E3 ubiquitin transferase n=1 Tax=Panicum hallii var. hallii TaxID=1504633 RepID=A0A2T7DXW3_9POAL|nr:LOW QUALITY PROTEIN: hypothetical protein GQ55_4G124000 [Panicum hallii var. hallii]